MIAFIGLALAYLALVLGAVALLAGFLWCVEKLYGFISNHLQLQAMWWRFVFWKMHGRAHPDLAEHIEARKKAEEAVESARGLVKGAFLSLKQAGLLDDSTTLKIWGRVTLEGWIRDNAKEVQ